MCRVCGLVRCGRVKVEGVKRGVRHVEEIHGLGDIDE